MAGGMRTEARGILSRKYVLRILKGMAVVWDHIRSAMPRWELKWEL